MFLNDFAVVRDKPSGPLKVIRWVGDWIFMTFKNIFKLRSRTGIVQVVFVAFVAFVFVIIRIEKLLVLSYG